MKLKLLFAIVALLCAVSSWAREDVTSTYLTDAALENEAGNWGYSGSGGNHKWDNTNKYRESWHNIFTITQTTAPLHAGFYQLSIQAAVQGGNSTTISLQATSGSNSSVAVYPKYSTHSSYADMAAWWAADASHTGNRDLNRIFTTVYVEEGQTLTATFKQTANNQWFVYGQMQLHKLTDEEGRCAQLFEAVYNPLTNQDMAGGRFKQRFEDYTAGTVTGKKLTKTISSLPNGKYNVTLNGGASYTSGRGFSGNTGDDLTTFFANDASTNVTVVNRIDIGNNEFTDYTASNALVSDGNLEVGFNNKAIGANWFVGSIKYIEYLGSCLMHDAVALPDNGDMAADKWYYFNPGAGSFNLTATDLSKIVYTSDGTILTSAAGSISTTFGANPVTLTNTTYYIKSSKANNFAYEADSYDLTEQKAAYNTAVINAGTAKTNAEAADKVNAAEKKALDEAITRYGSIDYSGPQNKALKDALETATATLTSATNTVNTSITAYANAKAYFDAVKPVLETTNFYTSAAYASNYSTPKAAYEEGTLSDVDAAALSYGSRRDGSIPAILLSSWAGTTLYINTWSKESAGVAPARDFATPFFEYWVADGNNLAATTFTSTIGGLTANALYAVTLNARVKQRDKNRKVADGITLKVGSGDAVDLTRGQHIAMTRRFIDSYTAYGYTNADGELVTTITVAENSNISWLAFRDVNYAHVEGATALDKVIAEVTALNGHVPTNVYSTANTVVTKHTDANYPTTDAEFATAISEIRAAAATAAAYKSEYESYLELKAYADALVAVDNNNPLANSTLTAAISTAATNVKNVADVAALTSVNTTLKTAMVTYAGAANPVGDGNKFDLTFMLGKVKFDDCITWENPTVNGFDGWATEQSGGNFQVMENESVTSGDYHSFIEYWSANPQTNSKFNLYTTVSNLPEGTYTMSCYAFAGPDGYAGAAASSEVYFYANDTQGGKVSDFRLTQKEITFVNASEQDVKIGLKPVTGNTWRWMGIGYVKMYKTPAADDVVLDESRAYVEGETAADVLLTKTIYKGFNTLVLPFSMTSSEITTVLGDGKLYEFTGADAGSLNFNEVSTLAAHTPYLFKADADKIIRGERISGRTITVSTNSLKVAGTDYNLQGTYTPYAKNGDGNPIVAERDYVLGADNNFHLTTTQNALKAFRAYIQANEASPVKALSICIDGETTAIESLNGETMTDGAIYNMAGQRVNKAVKGLYIVNGKKMLVK